MAQFELFVARLVEGDQIFEWLRQAQPDIFLKIKTPAIKNTGQTFFWQQYCY
jgi:hypothetical protein